MIYTGRQQHEEIHHNLVSDVVMRFASPYFGSGREIFTDRYFTSHSLAMQLVEKNLTLVGSMMIHMREVPSDIKSAKGELALSTVALYDYANKIILLSYAPKRNKNVLMLSSSHSSYD